jgi:aryl-alcohol dehydrogenase-like predicted oxidoreductase
MERIRLGGTGLKVSPLAFGTMTLGDPVAEDTSLELLDFVVDQGINFIDTANGYNAGLSEEIIGKWMKARGNRERIVLATKVRYAVGGDPDTAGSTPKVILREVENSLRRLNTDYIDIYYLHQPDDDTPIEITWRALESLVSSGKIRYIGVSNFAAWQVVEAVNLARNRGWTPPTVTQALHNAISRAAETELLPMTRAYDIGTCMYNPLAGGLLTGKYKAGKEAGSDTRFAANEMYRKRYWNDPQRTAADQFSRIAAQRGRTSAELALRYMLDHPNVDVTLFGATRREQVEQNLAAVTSSPLSTEELNLCDEIWAELHGPVPQYNRTNAKMQG